MLRQAQHDNDVSVLVPTKKSCVACGASILSQILLEVTLTTYTIKMYHAKLYGRGELSEYPITYFPIRFAAVRFSTSKSWEANISNTIRSATEYPLSLHYVQAIC